MNLVIVKNYFVVIQFLFYQSTLTLICCYLDNDKIMLDKIKKIKNTKLFQKISVKSIFFSIGLLPKNVFKKKRIKHINNV